MKTNLLLRTTVNTLPKLLGRIKLSNFLSMSEEEFQEYIRLVENDPLFKELMYPEDPKFKIISRRRFPNARFHYSLNEDLTTSQSNHILQELLSSNEGIINFIRKLGQEKFEKYFLYNECNLSLKEISDALKLNIDKIKEILNFVNSFLIASELNPHPYTSIVRPIIKIARITIDKNSKFLIEYLNGDYARGRYVINYKLLYKLKQENKLPKEKIKKIDKLIKKLELINLRKNIVHRILEKIVEKQKKYFKTGDPNDLVVLKQNELSKELKIHPGTTSRLLNNKSIETPFGEKKLRFFICNQKRLIKMRIKELLLNKGKMSDAMLCERIRQKYKVKLSRRTICQYRNELEKTIEKW